jgi:Tol biopolymer transport system component
VLISLGTSYPIGLSYSPDGAFVAYGVSTSTGSRQIWRATAKGKSRTKLTSNGSRPIWG